MGSEGALMAPVRRPVVEYNEASGVRVEIRGAPLRIRKGGMKKQRETDEGERLRVPGSQHARRETRASASREIAITENLGDMTARTRLVSKKGENVRRASSSADSDSTTEKNIRKSRRPLSWKCTTSQKFHNPVEKSLKHRAKPKKTDTRWFEARRSPHHPHQSGTSFR